MTDIKSLKREIFDLENKVARFDVAIAAASDKSERARLIHEKKPVLQQLLNAANKLSTIKTTEQLNEQQAKRDKLANKQDNGSGKTRNRQRDIL